MTEEQSKKSLLGRVETIFLIILAVVFLIWAIPTCRSDRPETPADNTLTQPDAPTSGLIPIYVAVDSLNMRESPQLNSPIVIKIPFGEQINYLHERTDFTQRLYMNDVLQSYPWVKVRTPEGIEGWIYAGGVRFYPVELGDQE